MMKPRVFVFEDDEACRTYLSFILESQGYETLTFSDPTACPVFSASADTCPHELPCGDFLLTDYRMPNMSGLDLIEMQLRKGCKGAISRKAVLSATWTPESLERAEKLGCKVFHKPYDQKAILEWMAEQEKTLDPGRKIVAL